MRVQPLAIAIINGPNLNLVGTREVSVYGTMSLTHYLEALQERHPEVQLTCFQSNHEGDLIDQIQAYGLTQKGIILNAGGYTHTSIALRDAVAAISIPVIEVHISDLKQREPFRQFSYLTDVCVATIMGHGLQGYEEAVEKLKEMV